MLLGPSVHPDNYGKTVLLKCGCIHNFISDIDKYKKINVICGHAIDYCPKCNMFGWAVSGLNYKQLRNRDRI